jgi:hypothetical protein
MHYREYFKMSMFRKIFVLLFSIFLFAGLQAQTISIHHSQLQFLFEDSILQNTAYHSVIKPVEVNWQNFEKDLNVTKSFQSTNNKIFPVFDAIAGYDHENKSGFHSLDAGFYAVGRFSKNTGYEISAVLKEQLFSSERSCPDSLDLIYGYNRPFWQQGKQTVYGWARGFAWWKPNRWLTLKFGNDKHFIGDGYRSFVLSENAAAYPFIETDLHIWRIQYMHQTMILRDLVPGMGSHRANKYVAQHTLSYNITKWLNININEMVIWRGTDSAKHYRGLDIAYLNPFLFYRPTEFNMGSPDNVLLGIGGKLFMSKKSYLYGQLILDEFRLKEIKANTGWWGNKYGLQSGFKTFGLLKNYPSMLQIEFDQCRPFTYSHTYSLENYGYLYMPLAHPQGSNFREGNFIFRVSLSKNWFVHFIGNYLIYGTDPDSSNYGSDIYKQAFKFTNTYGNYIGQGIKTTQISASVIVSKMIIPQWRFQAFGQINMVIREREGLKSFIPAVQLGFNTLLYD